MVASARPYAISPAELATISSRVVNCLSMLSKIQKREREDILGKAIEFIEVVDRGDQIMKTGQLRANASDSLRNYGWFTRAFSLLSHRPEALETQDFSDELLQIRNTLTALKEGGTVTSAKMDEMKRLFAYLCKIALAVDNSPTDKLTII